MAELNLPRTIVTVEWLASRLGHPRLVILDASMRPVGSAGAAPDDGLRIPGSRRFDFDDAIRDRSSPLPHMMPPAPEFEAAARALGISRDSAVVVYDRVGLFSSPRAWWMFRAMGHDAVAVLDGGLPAWRQAGLALEPMSAEAASGRAPAEGDFVARPRAGAFCGAEEVRAALADPAHAVLDARSPGRFAGTEPEPRSGLRSGHMPGAFNLPFAAVQKEGRMLPEAELRALIEARAGARKSLVFSCGSGVTACVLALAAERAGYRDFTVYDGSWSEWGMPGSGLPVEKS